MPYSVVGDTNVSIFVTGNALLGVSVERVGCRANRSVG
jgi:hypothetical protein